MVSRSYMDVVRNIDKGMDSTYEASETAPQYTKGAPSMSSENQDAIEARQTGMNAVNVHRAWQAFHTSGQTDSDVARLQDLLGKEGIVHHDGDDGEGADAGKLLGDKAPYYEANPDLVPPEVNGRRR